MDPLRGGRRRARARGRRVRTRPAPRPRPRCAAARRRRVRRADRARAEDYLRQCAKHRQYADAHRLRRGRGGDAPATPRRPPRRCARPSRRCATPSRSSAAWSRARASRTTTWPSRSNTFDAMVAAEITRREEAEGRADAAGRLEQLLDGRSLDELAAAAAGARAALDAHVAAHGARRGGRPDRAARPRPTWRCPRAGSIEELAELRARIEEREVAHGRPRRPRAPARGRREASGRASRAAATRRAWRARSWPRPPARRTSGSRRT